MSLEVSQLCFGYRGQPVLLDRIEFSLGNAETLCILGPNGCGKTTLLRCLLGINPTASGSIVINGVPVRRMSRREVAKQMSYVPQSSTVLFPFNVLEMVLMGRTPHVPWMAVPSEQDRQRGLSALQELGISHLKNRLFNELSGGERQLVLIARALCQEANTMLLDEPTASLDYGNQIRILKVVNRLRDAGFTIVMTAHDPDHAFRSATHAATMKGGRFLSMGAPEAILTGEALSELYQTHIGVMTATFPEAPGKQIRASVPFI